MSLSRREMVAGLGVLGLPLAPRPPVPPSAEPRSTAAALPVVPAGVAPERLARDEGFWNTVARQYRVSRDFVNLENGYYGIMPEPVRRAYHRNTDHLNEVSSYLLRNTYKGQADQVRKRIATMLGVSMEEIALTRGGTEALQLLIAGYLRLRPGDSVMYADLDYHSMQYSMNWLRDRRGVRVERLVIPEPATRQAVLDAYAQAFREHPRVRLLLLSHMNNRTGLVVPVREIAAMARERGIDVIVDAAHSWGHLDFTLGDLDADFAGFSLHKWMGMPLGAGFLYIRKDRLADIDVAFGDETFPRDDIRSRVHAGTLNVAPVLTADAALDFHDTLGAAAKQARLRFLRDRWVGQVLDIDNLEILTPEEPAMYGTITAFRITGRTSEAENVAIATDLMKRYRIFTVNRGGPARGSCVRVTPALFSTCDDVDLLAVAVRDIAGRMRG
ncbi:aminotransferase class V-fold PLP-dependent enzyme [Streptosporangium sp. NBC_01755]|uniref:aminotransferase class V-fold PLP-dependent enzyme n=1 Tax=unclassified Streptosporangium TaxID=2632669 RepID=UPI002DDA73FD|nr:MULTISPECIES: aminotransferase class V-fold PLP-dependent enzyme [unclassified Streptosporangium]WSA28164.1 aminotransferase class V-fold PLP-dependent enzyme [Streptosporangium sp. NBC_01810]WSD00360.1 aminotransferase class V-fold PLP-dependent enzyme [Streptosporangium sp. NBC_01755]